MPSYAGRFEYVPPGGGVPQSGPCELSFDAETATLVPTGGAPLAFDLGDIDAFTPGDYELRLSLAGGHAVRLERFAKAFQDLERQLLEAYRTRLVKCLLVSDLDEVARYDGRVRVESRSSARSGPAELRLYESNLAVLPDGAPGFQWRLAEIDSVEFDQTNYAVVVARGGDRLTVSHLAKRTGELADLVRSRSAILGQRSARTLRALFPFLAPDRFQQAARLLRDGACAPTAALSAIDPSIERVLVDKVVDGALQPYVETLVRRASGHDWYAGFKVIRSEADEGAGGEAVGGGASDGEQAPDAGGASEGPPSKALEPAVFDAGDGLEVLYWFFFPLAADGAAPSRVAWEATSRGGRATYVFRLASGEPLDEGVQVLNRGLVALNFRREPVYLDGRRLETELRYRHYAIARRKVPELGRVREAFVGRAIHASHAGWEKQLEGLLSA